MIDSDYLDLGGVETPQGSSFFGTISGAFETGISRIGSEVLPNWAAQQMGLQSEDQLEDPLFQGQYAQPRLGDPQYAAAPQYAAGPGFFEEVLFNVGTLQITGGAIVLMGAVFIGSIIILKKVI